MVKSRKYAIVTAALALILVAAVVLTVVLVGNGSFYTPEQDGIASNAAVTVGSNVGTVDSDYTYNTLVAHSQKKNSEWDESDLQDLRDGSGNSGTDGVAETYVTTLDTDFFLITQEGWTSVDKGEVSGGGSGYYELQYNGVWYRFLNGNASSTINTSLYQSYSDFMGNTAFYRSSSAYGLMVTDISYNPNSFATNQYFDATLDGNGKTLSATALLSLTTTSSTLAMSYQDLGYNISKDGGGTQRMSGTVFTGMVFGSLRNGTFKNFQWTDAKISGSGTHVSKHTPTMQGTAFGGLVGYAGSDTIGGNATSYVNNISLVFNHNVQHISDSHSYSQWNHSRAATYTGGLIGINYSANIELVRVRLNSGIVIEQQTYNVRIPTSWDDPDNAFGCFGGIVGIQMRNRTFSKVIISGASATSALYGHHCSTDHGSIIWQDFNTTEERMGCVIGAMGKGCTITLNGVILDMNYSECYAWLDKEKNLYRGMMVGEALGGASAITYKDIYITDMVFAGSFEGNKPGPENVGGGDFRPITTHYDGAYTAQYWFYGDSANVRAFAYLDDAVVKDVSFSDDADKMLQITAPNENTGVMWNVTYRTNDGSITTLDEDVFTQNSRENVQVSAWTTSAYTDTSKFVRMTIEYASSYTFDVTNGPNGDNTGNKYYDGKQVNFPALSLNIPDSDYIMSTGTQYTDNGYITITENGSGGYKLNFNNGSGAVGEGISNLFNASGVQYGNDFGNIIAAVLQLEAMQNKEYGIIGMDSWNTQTNVNTYRWSSLGMFAMQDSSGNRYVFAPSASPTLTTMQITRRPIYVSVNNDNKNVPYIGNSYNVASGTSAQAGNVFFSFGTTADDGEDAIISGDEVLLQNITLTRDNSAVSVAQDAGTYAINATTLEGGARNNYTLVAGPSGANTFVIDKAQVTLTVTGGSATYGFTKPANAAEFMQMVNLSFASSNSSLTGFASRDNITVNMNIQTGDTSTSAGQWLITPMLGGGSVFAFNFPAGEYTVEYEGLSGSGINNYEIVDFENSTPFVVNKARLAVNLPSIDDFVYGDSPVVGTPSYAGLLDVDSVSDYTISYFSGSDAYSEANFVAGSYTARAVVTAIDAPGSAAGINNYDVQYNTSAFEVSKRDTTVQFDFDPSKTYSYKGEAYNFTAVALGNPAFSDTADGVTFQAYSDVNRVTAVEALNAGTYYAGAVSDTLSANYNVTGITDTNGDAWETFVIQKATVKLTNTGTTSAEYDGSPVEFDENLITINYGEVPTLADEVQTLKDLLEYAYNGSASAPINAGEYNVTVTLPEQSNFNSATLSISNGLFIAKMVINIVPKNASVEVPYNGVMIPDLTYTVTGGGETITGLDITTQYYVGAAEDGVTTSNLRDVGTYTIVYSYDGTTGNYASTSTQVTYTVTQKSLTLTLSNANVTYNKEAYSPDYTVEGLITGDDAQITYTVSPSGSLVEGEVKNAGTYEFTFSAGNGNYKISEDTAVQEVVIAPYVLTAQALNTTVFFNSSNKTPGYYENQLNVRVLDADGTDITDILSGSITKDLIVSTVDQTSVTEVGERGGNYAVKVTINSTSLPEGYDENNYTSQENIYAVFVYRIALGGKLTGGTDADSVTYDTGFDIKGVLTAQAGEGTQPLTVNDDKTVNIGGSGLTDVTSITISSATFAVNGVTLAMTDNVVELPSVTTDVNTIFNLGVFNEGFANAGTYTATITITLDVNYQDSGQDRSVKISAPFTWTVDPYKIQVTAGQLDKYYTEAITTSDVRGAVTVDEQYADYITVVSSVIDDTSSTFVNAGNYTYDVVLNTGAAGYYNYTLPEVSTGDIVVSPLKLVVTVGNLSEQYGDAIAPTATAQLFKGEVEFETEDTRVTSQYSWTTSSSESAGTGVGNYEDALTATVTATDNFEVKTFAGDLEITKRMLGIALNNVTMAYSTGEIAVTYRITSGSLYGDDKQPVLVNFEITADGKVADLDRLAVGGYDLNVNVQGEAFNNSNYGIESVANGTLTVTPYEITSVTWNAPEQLVYKGAAFESGELYTVENFVNGNGDVVTFSVSYGGEVKNAGSYSARVAVASVTNGADPVDAGNYSVANVAAQSFSVAKANLAVSNIRGFANENGVLTVSGTYNTQSQAIATDEIKFSFGDGIAYDSALHGAITVSVGHSASGIPTDPVNAGSYDVTVSVSGAENFNNATISGITLVIDKWILTEEEAAENFVISFDESYVYDSQEHGATLAFQGTLANFAAPYTFTYYLQASDGSLSQASPVNAGTYLISLTVGNDNYEYTTAEGSNEGSIVVTPTDRIQLSFTVPTSEGLPQNNVYYTGSPIVPEMSATITVTGSAERVTSSDAFTFTFYVATTADDPNAIDLSTVPGMGLPSGTYYYSDVVSEAVRPSSYYIVATFNSDGTYSNYKTGYQQLYVVGGAPTAMVITFGAMSVRVVSGLTRSYDGTIGFNGHDVIYSDADGLYWINTDIVQFTGVDLTGMDNLKEDLKVGDITVSVYFLYERTVQDGATVERKTKLYDWNWQFDSDADERLDPKKTVYSEAVMEGGVQIQGPMNGITDFGYANGIQTAEYVVEVSIDNTDNDYYSSAVEITIGEDGQPDEQLVPHSASGYAYIEPADIQFEMFYTNDFYNDATNMVAEATGGYRELNDSVEDSVELQVLTADQIREISHYLMRGVALSVDENYDWLSGVTRTKYAMDEGGALYNYEVLAAQYINVTIKNSAGQTVYTYIDGVHTSQNGGVTNAGTYTIKFEFSGISGKYMPFTYTGTFVQQKAEYHITVTQKEGANLTTEFGVEFDVSDIAGQLEVKVELGDGGYTTATGKYTAFEDAVAQSGGDMSTLDSYIRLVGTDGGISTEYNTNTYKSNVGSYFIYYVYTSVDSNLEIVMETESSKIEVTKTAPSFMVNAEDERVDEKEGLDLGSQSYTPNTSWNNDIIKSVGLGIEYKSLEGLTGEYYTTNKVAIATIEYSADGDVWTSVEVISSVGKYRVTIAAAGEGAENAEANLEGALNGVYVFFEVTRISAQADVVVTGSDLVWSDEAGAYIATFNGNTHAIGYSVTAGGNAVSDSSLQGTVNILIAFTENAADGDYVDINTSPIVGAGSYWVKVTVTGSENYDVTPSDAVKITINKADPTIRFEQSEYNMTYSLKGNTIPAGDYSFELDGRNPAPDITAENSSVYYLSAPISGSGDVAGAQAQVAAMVNAFIASGAENIVEWLEQKAEEYPGYKFTSVDGTRATDVGYYFPVVIFNGDDNYNRSGALVANVPHPVITVAKATLVLAVTIVDDMYVVYGSAPGGDISDTKEIGKYVSMDWSYTDADGGVVTVDSGIFGQIVSGFTYRLINCNQYVQGTAVGTVPNAYLFVVDSFESTNFDYTYDQGGYVNIQVTPATVAFDVSKGSVSLESDIADQAPVALTADGYTFNRVYSGGSFGPLAFAYAGNTGLDVNGDNAENLDDRGFGKHGIFTVSASGGYTQEAVSAAGSYTGSITITLNNSNYVVDGMEEGTLTLPVNLVIDKAIIQISFDYLTYAAFDGKTYTEKSSAGAGEHLGWYEYATIYTGANFDYNNRVYVTSYRYDENGELEAYGAYSGGKRLGEVGGITESDGASGNLAAPGEYNIHLALDQLATNYKFIDSAGNTVGQAADGSQADLSSLDINVTISPSKFVETGNSLAADVKPLFAYADGVYSREFDGTDLTAAFLKTFLSVVPYKLSNTAGTLKGSIAAPNSQVQLTVDRDYAAELIGNNLIVELLSGGAAVDSAMYAGDYTLSVRLNNNAYSMDDMQFTLKITPASDIEASVSVKGQTARTYNGLDIVPNITLTLTVTDYNGNKHTIGVPSYTANVYKQVGETTPGTPTFSYGVVNGDVDTAAINGQFTDAGTYIVRLVISNPNVSVTELSGHDQTYTINARPLTDGSIRSTYEKLFSYRTTVNSGGEVVPVAVSAEDLKVLITYNRTTNLVLGEDFTIDFGTTGAGQYTGNYEFTINGMGNFTGVIAGSYSIGASVGIVSAPDAITYGDDSVTVKLNINSLGSNSLAGDLTLNFVTGSSSRIVDANDNTVAQLGVPSKIVISANEVSGNEFDVVFTGLGAVNAGEYFLDLVFSCTYAGITTEGTISREVSGETASKVVVDEADVATAATGVTATVTAVNSTTVSFNISGMPSAYEYSVDGGETWIKANKGSNTISGLTAGTAFNVLLRINDVNYASSENVHEYPLASALSFTTTASVDDIIASAESLANNFNATGFARYAQLLQNVASVSSGDLAARGDEIEEALAAVEEARAEYIEDLQAAIDSAVGAAEKAAGKASGVSGAATAGLVAGGVAMPVLGIGLIFAAARKRKSKEEDLND